mmetsp:Transcript_4185/g.12576  ORF Transcript_4185/g.12576 Transcript_4185/m.12576 type:complete len:459 (+) Transcript_4185:81-1457(+)
MAFEELFACAESWGGARDWNQYGMDEDQYLNVPVPERIEQWLLHEIEDNHSPKNLNESLLLHTQADRRDWEKFNNDMNVLSRTFLIIPQAEYGDWCVGIIENGDHPLVPGGIGRTVITRFAIAYCSDLGSYVMFASTLYSMGYISIASYVTDARLNTISRNSIFHRRTPYRTVFKLVTYQRSTEDGAAPTHRLVPEQVQLQRLEKRSGPSIWQNYLLHCPMSETLRRSFDLIVFRRDRPAEPFSGSLKNATLTYTHCEQRGKHLELVRTKFAQKLLLQNYGPSSGPCTDERPRVPLLAGEIPQDAQDAQTEQKVNCQFCGSRFKRKYELNRHVQTIHSGVRRFTCSVCNRAFTQAAHVRVHVETVHEGRRDERCKICNLTFGTKHKLVRHRRAVHEKERSCVCHTCGRSYFQNSDLKRHMNSKHSEQEQATSLLVAGDKIEEGVNALTTSDVDTPSLS